jgi:hypothetical protein
LLIGLTEVNIDQAIDDAVGGAFCHFEIGAFS